MSLKSKSAVAIEHSYKEHVICGVDQQHEEDRGVLAQFGKFPPSYTSRKNDAVNNVAALKRGWLGNHVSKSAVAIEHSYEEHEISGVDPQREEDRGCSGAIWKMSSKLYKQGKIMQ